MSREQDLAFLKMYFTLFGEDLCSRLEKQYDKKGLSFVDASMERMCVKLTEELGEVAECVFKDMDKAELESELIDVASVALMMYIKLNEK